MTIYNVIFIKISVSTNSVVKSVLSKKYMLVALLAFLLLFIPRNVSAQVVELGISPPLVEVVVAPGKSLVQRYLVSNFSDNDIALTPQLYKLEVKDEFGTADIANVPESAGVLYDFFTIAGSPLDQDKVIQIASGQTIELPLTITVPEGIEEIDYYAVLVLQSSSEVQTLGSGQTAHAAIASNILISVSSTGLPAKNASVIEFDSPSIVDSFFPISFNVRIRNTGNSFFKPIGDIETKGLFAGSRLGLAPSNILSGSTRQILCVSGEELVDCKQRAPFLLGKYVHTLSFTLDEEGRQIIAESETVALPFSLGLGLFALFALFKIFHNRFKKSAKLSLK